MRIDDNVAVVASGRLGFGFTSPYDCNAYLVSDGDDAVLIDAGCGAAARDTVNLIAASGVDPAQVSRILLTHSHTDHAAGAAVLAELLQARILAPAASAAALRAGDTEASLFTAAQRAGKYPADLPYPAVPVSDPMVDGAVLAVGSLTLTACAGPGHSYDHTTYRLHRDGGDLVFCGDLLMTDGRVILNAAPDCRLDLYAETVHRLAEDPPAGLLPGHGAFTRTDAADVLAAASACFRRLVPPPHL
jgi:glyoxylase-like metal-dependent hydrolase (beta-lactamase superfamily II)